MFIIKIKGKTKIPDYVQLRDEDYTLLAYFRADRPEKALIKCGFEHKIEELKQLIENLPFGKMHKLEL
ncbi:MAG: fructose-6-phosphate aldolase [Bacteroidia bacterium]